MIALFTALIAPYFVDWTAYKQDFEKQASRIIGQKVLVAGEANVRLLPLPSISFTNLSIGDMGSSEPMMTVSRFNANVELMPFLSGEIRIVDMSLDNPIFNLEVDQNGKIAWTERQESIVDPRQVKLDRLTIRNAEFNLKGLSPDRTISGKGIDADVSALSLYGPWRITGGGEIDGQESQFDFSTGLLSEDNSIRLKADLARADKPYELNLDGTVSLKKEVLSWVGIFGINPFESKKQLSQFKDNLPLPVRIKGDFSLSPTRLELPAYSIDIGSKEDPFSLSGKGAAKLKGGIDFRLQIDGRQVDLNRIAKMREGEAAKANTLETRVDLFRDVLAQIPVPPFKGEIDLEIPAIIAGDTFIREVSSIIRPFGEGWEIIRLKSNLPGNTVVEAKGRLGTGEQFGFHGDLLIASRQPSGFAAWAAGKVDPAIRRLSSVGLSANVTLTPGQINLDQMELILDQNRLSGSIQRLAPEGEEGTLPAIVANLKGDEIRLEDLRAVASLFTGKDTLSLENDFDVSLQADKLSAFELDAQNVDLQFQYKNSELSVGRFNLDNLLGTSIKSTGQITNFLKRPRGNMALDISADDFQSAAQFIGEKYGWISPLRALASDESLSKNSSLKVEFDSRPVDVDGQSDSRNRVIISGHLGDTLLNVRGGFKGKYSALRDSWIDASLEAENANGEILLKQLGLGGYGFSPIQSEMSAPLKLNIESVGSADEGYSTIVSMNNDETSLSAKGSVSDFSFDHLKYDFDVILGSSNIAPLVYSFGLSLPQLNPILGDVAPFSSKFKITSVAEGALQLEVQKGQLYGNAIAGELELGKTEGGKRLWVGNLKTDYLSLNTISELASGAGFVDGLGQWSQTEFSPRVFADQSVKLKVSAKTADVGAVERAEDVSLVFDLTEARVFAKDISFNWNGADVAGNATLSQIDGSLVLNSQLSASKLDAEKLLSASPLPSVLTGQGSVNFSIDGSGKSPRALVGSLSGSGVGLIDKGRLVGIRRTGLEEILEAADEEEFEISASNIEPLAVSAFLVDEAAFTNLSAPFSISSGKVQFRNIIFKESVEVRQSGLTGDLSFGLLNHNVDVSLRLAVDGGKEQVSGGSPEVTFSWNGPADTLALSVDTNSLEGYLSIRAFEIEQRRVETLQANILEKQRFRYELLKSNERSRWLEDKRKEAVRLAEEEALRIAKEEAEAAAAAEAKRIAAEAEAKAQREAEEAAEAARVKQEAEEAALVAEILAAEKAAEQERLAAQEAERIAQEKLENEIELQRQREAQLEADRISAEAASEIEKASKPEPSRKQGFEVKPLAPPKSEPRLDIFKNIEQLLFQN